MPRSLIASVACALALTSGAASANDVSVRAANTWATDGYVSAAAAANGVVYIAGSFSALGPRTGALAAVDRATNLPLDWPRFTGGSVTNVLADDDGGYLVQGTYRLVDGRPANGLVRLSGTGQVDPAFRWTPTPALDSVFLAGGRLVVTATLATGAVSAIVDRHTGGLIAGPLPFAILGAGTGPSGALIARVLVPPARSGMVQLNATTGAIERVIYTPPAGLGLSAMTVSGGQAFVATSAGASGEVLRVDLTTGTATTLATVTGTSSGRFSFPAVTKILHHFGRLYLQGNVTAVNGTLLPALQAGAAAIDATTGALSAWRRPGSLYGVDLLAADGDRLIAGMSFVPSPENPAVGGPGLIGLDAETGADTGWRLPVLTGSGSARPTAAIVEPSRLVVGGSFTGIGITRRSGLAAITLPDGRPTAWAPAGGRIDHVAVSGSRVFAVEGNVNRLAEYDANTGTRAGWTAVTTGLIRRITLSGNRLFLVGQFTAVDGLPRNGAASFDLTTSPPTVETWTAPFETTDVSAIHVLPQAVLLGGAFPTGGAGPIHRLLALDPATGTPLPWFPTVNDRLGQGYSSLDLAVTADRIFVSGFFDTVNGQPRPRLALFDFGGRLLPWQVDDARGIWLSARLTLFEDRAYVTGECCGSPVGVAFDLTSGRRTGWVPVSGTGSSGGAFLAVPDMGLLRYAFSSDSDQGGFSFYPRIPSIPAVTGLRGVVTGSRVQIAWNAAPGAESYVIEAGSAPGLSNLAVVNSGSAATSYTATVVNGRYYVRVRGVNESGAGPASTDLAIVVGAGGCAAAPDAPTALQATTSGLTATLTWQAPAGGETVTQYAVDLVSGTGSPLTLARVTATSLSASGPPGAYALAVRAENSCGSSAATPPVAVILPSS